jgi:hypothetical protein
MPFGCDLEIIREQARSHNTFFYQLLWGEACCGSELAREYRSGVLARDMSRKERTYYEQKT